MTSFLCFRVLKGLKDILWIFDFKGLMVYDHGDDGLKGFFLFWLHGDDLWMMAFGR